MNSTNIFLSFGNSFLKLNEEGEEEVEFLEDFLGGMIKQVLNCKNQNFIKKVLERRE